ncbi:serine hydrolase domain-containing protein [Georgenia subflava]|uniref:Serine hydrolase n=1 Tax=Georgenia subflava TaxID=1622177 RepID=A0A6N7EBQ3_9MICO|nr:serine hydrolase domain-containing protein [Georgenia subflava]MPV35842.1 serine hydrolase [Georgenia subflava]
MDVPVELATERMLTELRDDPRFRHMAHVLVRTGGHDVADVHLRGPERLDLFSVTKTVVVLLLGIAVEDGLLGIDDPVAEHLPFRPPPTISGQTVRHLAAMTRGARTDGPWDLDAVAGSGRSWGRAFVEAPTVAAPGTTFRYDNGGSHLLATVLDQVTGGLGEFAGKRLFGPLGVVDWDWRTDPDGVPVGAGHLCLTARAVADVGGLFLDGGAAEGRQLVPRRWLAAMRTPTGHHGGPENRDYGLGLWVEDHETAFGAGWGGQLMLVRRRDRLVVVVQTDTGFRPGPPPSDELPGDWAQPLELVRRHLLQARRPPAHPSRSQRGRSSQSHR